MGVHDVAMPRLSDSMEEGTILKWLKSDGDAVRRGEELVEIETDKANMTFEAEQEGTLAIVAKEGDTLAVGATIARVGAGAAANGRPARVKASPVARRVARELGLELAGLVGTGPDGRIVRADVEAAAPAPPAPAPAGVEAAAPAPPAPPPAGVEAAAPAPPAPAPAEPSGRGTATREEPTRLQQTVARRMAESKATAPEFALAVEVDMGAAVELRAQLKAAAGESPAPSYNDFVVKAAALALRVFPRANGAYRDGRFELYSRVNVGIAVAGPDALVVATVFDADQKSLGTIAREARALAERARSGAITPPELSGGTFAVSNLGMYGIRRFTAVINPPQAAILAVGELAPRAVVREGELAVRPTLELTLTCDHRILYGEEAARFLTWIRELLERPLRLAL